MHLIDSDGPIRRGTGQSARCGAVVKSANPLHLWDSGDLPMLEAPRGMCKKCLEVSTNTSGRTFVYAVQEMNT